VAEQEVQTVTTAMSSSNHRLPAAIRDATAIRAVAATIKEEEDDSETIATSKHPPKTREEPRVLRTRTATTATRI